MRPQGRISSRLSGISNREGRSRAVYRAPEWVHIDKKVFGRYTPCGVRYVRWFPPHSIFRSGFARNGSICPLRGRDGLRPINCNFTKTRNPLANFPNMVYNVGSISPRTAVLCTPPVPNSTVYHIFQICQVFLKGFLSWNIPKLWITSPPSPPRKRPPPPQLPPHGSAPTSRSRACSPPTWCCRERSPSRSGVSQTPPAPAWRAASWVRPSPPPLARTTAGRSPSPPTSPSATPRSWSSRMTAATP